LFDAYVTGIAVELGELIHEGTGLAPGTARKYLDVMR
jgi:hypothetical protein